MGRPGLGRTRRDDREGVVRIQAALVEGEGVRALGRAVGPLRRKIT